MTNTQDTIAIDRHPISEKQAKQLENNFKYHSPKGSQQERYVALREKAKELAYLICECSHESREQSLALTNLESAIMWANAGIARNE